MALAMKYRLLYVVLCVGLLGSLVACGEEEEQVTKGYASVAECSADTITSDSTEEQKTQRGVDCQKAFDQSLAEHQTTAHHYNSMNECVGLYGENQCIQRGDSFYPS